MGVYVYYLFKFLVGEGLEKLQKNLDSPFHLRNFINLLQSWADYAKFHQFISGVATRRLGKKGANKFQKRTSSEIEAN